VNIHIHQFQPGSAVADAAALAQFQEQWATCRKNFGAPLNQLIQRADVVLAAVYQQGSCCQAAG
jgi:hypothetical protein